MAAPMVDVSRTERDGSPHDVPQRSFARGEWLYLEDEPGRVVFLVEAGLVALSKASPMGEHIVGVVGPGGLVGEHALGREPSTAMTSAMAVNQVRAAALDRRTMARLRSEDRRFDEAMTELLARELRAVVQFSFDLANVPAEDRVLQRIARLVPVFRCGPGPVEILLAQADLAIIAAVSRQTVNKVLGGARRDGLIAPGRGRLTVLDPVALDARVAV